MITDSQYYEFLRKLHADQRGKNSLNLSEFETQFLYSFSMAERQTLWLTGDMKQGRRAVVDRMWRKHGPELQFPHPLDVVTERPKMAPADPGCCQYLVKDMGDAQQRRCNEPATCREPGKLLYCEAHGEAVKKAVKNIALVRL